MRRLGTRILWTSLAALFLFEAWLWDVLGAAIGVLVAVLPIEALRRGLRRMIDALPAGFALGLFILPILVILPFKLAALALLAKGRIGLGCGVFFLAKSAGLGATAFIFDVCHERLMTLGWFARLYARVIAIRDWAHVQVAPYRDALRAAVAKLRGRFVSSGPSLAQRLGILRARVQARQRANS